MKPAPILIFTYNRPWHTFQTLESLRSNDLASVSDVIIYSDGPRPAASPDEVKKIDEVRQLLLNQTWNPNIHVRISDTNKGLANSIIDGVTETLERYDRVIVLEDDMIISPYFLDFMNSGLTKYENVSEVISIHGYSLPVTLQTPYFLKGADCWGWATWRRGWKLFEPDGKMLLDKIREKGLGWEFDINGSYPYLKMLENQIAGTNNSWAIRWYASAFLNNKLTLYPGKSLVQNIGADNSGTHKQDKEVMKTTVSDTKITLSEIPVKESEIARKLISSHLLSHAGVKRKLKHFFRWGY